MGLFIPNRLRRHRRILLFVISIILLLGCTVSVAFSVYQVGEACHGVESLFLDGKSSPEEIDLLLNLNKKDRALFIENYTSSQLLAAALLMKEQEELEGAEFFLTNIQEDDSSVSTMAREQLLEMWSGQQAWEKTASYCFQRLKSGERAGILADHFFHALWAGELDRGNYPVDPENFECPWSLPFKAEDAILDRQEYISFLLKEDLNLIDEILGSWDSPFKEDVSGIKIRTARTLAEQGEFGKAETLFRELWNSELAGLSLLPSSFIMELRDVIWRSGRQRDWIQPMEEWTDLESGTYGAAFLAATVYEGNGEWEKAETFYGKAGALTDSPAERKRADWYQLRILVRHHPGEVTDYLKEHAVSWGHTDYFDDLLDEYYSLLVRRRRWGKLESLVSILLESSLEESLVQGLSLLESAVQQEFLEQPAYLADQIEARRLDAGSPDFYTLLEDPESWPFMDRGLSGISPEAPLLSRQEAAVEDVYRILIQAGAVERAFLLWETRKDPLGYDTVETLCSRLFQQKEFYRCIRFAGYWYYRWPSSVAVHLIPWLYPVDGELPVPAISRECGQPEELVLGIIRRESAFHRTIESHAGAVGLMQLMPSTASDLAKRHRVGSWDLMNPEDNIRLGSLYLEWLIERPWTENYIDVLAAYNGGGGNLRKWKRHSGDLDTLLFIQSIPYGETRNYIRKVIVAAGTYRYLNTGTSPGEWIDQLLNPFPVL